MKKIIYSLLAISLMFSCENQDDHGVDVNNFNGDTDVAYYTNGSSGTYSVGESSDAYTIEVGVTGLSSSDRTYTLEIDATSTATSGTDYSISNMSVTIPAGQYTTEVAVEGISAGTTDCGSNLILNLVGDGVMVNSQYDLFIIQLPGGPVDISGMYSVTTTYSTHDFLPDFASHTIASTEVLSLGENTYEIEDFNGGLYSVGPYAAAYGTFALPLVFTLEDGAITWSGQTEFWGTIELDSSGVNGYSCGEITISWTCPGYGETGVSIYTPL